MENDTVLWSINPNFIANGSSLIFPVWFEKILVPSLLVAICIGGIIANGIVLFVLLRCSETKTAPDVYILNLTSADLLFMFGIPFAAYSQAYGRYWPLGEAMCKIIYGLDGMNQYTGIFILTAMSVDRYLAVVHAIWSMKYRTVKVAKIVCFVIWLVSLLLSLPILVYSRIGPNGYGLMTCYISWGEHGDPYVIGAFVVGFAGPLSVISICYAQILIFLAKGARPGSNRKQKKKLGRVGLIVILAVALFTICWSPFWATQLALISPTYNITKAYTYVWSLAICFQYLNSALNPLVYTCVRADFRQNLTRICCGKKYAEASKERRLSKMLTTRTGYSKGNNHCSQTMYQMDDTGKTTTTIVNLNSSSQL
ncbi:somatostatin receptor type 5-like [Ptychodera flava]|uniref:somatostatin receptor type 5-like n=1 Tax=Ptychodera flava TaxID=63121 RepID=UPI00396A0D63